MASDKVQFMGITIEGDAYHGWHHYEEQKPLEDLYPYFTEAFAKGVKAIMWEQYIPAFNDGDPCEFSIGEVYLTGNQMVADAWLENEEPDWEKAYPEQEFDYIEKYNFSYSSSHPDGEEIGSIEDGVTRAFENALRATFGYNTTIVVTPTRVVQYEYYCGY